MSEKVHKATDRVVAAIGPYTVKQVSPLCGAPVDRFAKTRATTDEEVTCEACRALMEDAHE